MSETKPHDELRAAAARPLSLLQTLRAVAWSFLGIRRSDGYAQDVSKLNPVHVIIAGAWSAGQVTAPDPGVTRRIGGRSVPRWCRGAPR